MSFASNSLLKSGTFGSRPRKQKPGNKWRQRRNASGLSRFQLFKKIGPLHKHLLDIFYIKYDWMYRGNIWISYVINAVELVSFLLWRHTPSAIFSARPPRISMFQRSWTELIAETARNRQLRSPIKPLKFVRTPKKLAQLFRATKCFRKQKNCWTRRGTLSVRLWYIHWGLMQLKSSCGPRTMLSRFTSKRAMHYALNWFNCPIVCPFGAKSGKYYSRKLGKLMQLGKEMTVIA